MNDKALQTQEAAPPPAVSDTAAILQVIDRAASNPDVDIEKMERLLAMQERIFERNAEQAFNEAMRAAQSDMPQVTRDAENQQTRSRYARLETLSKAMKPVVTRHGFSMSYGTADSPLDGHYRITCRVSHVGGHSRDYHADVPADMTGMKGNQNKTATHGFGSTMSYGRRYLAMLIFDIAMTNEDDDGNRCGGQVVQLVSDEQVANLDALIEEVGANRDNFLKLLKVERLEDLPAPKYAGAVKRLEQKRAQANAG